MNPCKPDFTKKIKVEDLSVGPIMFFKDRSNHVYSVKSEYDGAKFRMVGEEDYAFLLTRPPEDMVKYLNEHGYTKVPLELDRYEPIRAGQGLVYGTVHDCKFVMSMETSLRLNSHSDYVEQVKVAGVKFQNGNAYQLSGLDIKLITRYKLGLGTFPVVEDIVVNDNISHYILE